MIPRRLSISVCSAALLLALAGGVGEARAAVVDTIAAVVEGKVITRSEVAALVREVGGDPTSESETAEAREELINRAVTAIEAEKRNIKVSDEEIDRAIAGIRERKGLDEEAFRQALVQQGLEWETYRKRLRLQLLGQKLFERVLREEYPSIESALRTFYLQNRIRFADKGAVRLLHLILPADVSPPLVEEVRKAATPEAFTARAKELFDSEPSDTGRLEESDLALPVYNAEVGLAPGKVSRVISTGDSIHLFYVVERWGGTPRSFAEARADVEAEFNRGGSLSLFNSWIERKKEDLSIQRIR